MYEEIKPFRLTTSDLMYLQRFQSVKISYYNIVVEISYECIDEYVLRFLICNRNHKYIYIQLPIMKGMHARTEAVTSPT